MKVKDRDRERERERVFATGGRAKVQASYPLVKFGHRSSFLFIDRERNRKEKRRER